MVNELSKSFCRQTVKKNGELFCARMLDRKTVCINRLANTPSEAIKFQRFLKNEEVTVPRLIHTEQARISPLVVGRHVLAIQDTTEINYERNAGRVHGLGTVGNGKDAGFFIHPMVVLDADTSSCLGFATVEIWNRLQGASKNYPRLRIEEKESYRWIKTAVESKQVLSKASCITFLGDRENDIYEFLDRIPDGNSHVITRVRSDRCLENGEKLYAYLDKQAEVKRIKITVPRDIRKNKKKREALLSIKYSEIEIKKPENCSDKAAAQTITLQVVEAKEVDCPAGIEPIHWRLFTTHTLANTQDALQIISWYKKRWNIEQVFRALKTQGLDIESSQVESGKNLMKLAVIALSAAIQIMQLTLARDGKTEQKTIEVFNNDETKMLEVLLKTVEGKTVKQQNPFPKENLGWASWIIARLGGWHGYKSSAGLPGPIVIGRGLKRFFDLHEGYKLYRDVYAE